MFTIIGGDGKEYGPATAEQIQGWIAAGRANLETKAKAAGSDEWRRLGDYPEFATATPPAPGYAPTYAAPAASATPSNSPEQVTGPIDPKAFAADLIARSGKIDVFSCLDRGFKLWTGHFGPIVGATLLFIVVIFAISLVPIAGSIAQLVLTGVFYGGLYYYYLGRMRGQTRTVGDIFKGFSRQTGSLIGAGILVSIVPLLAMMIFAGPWFVGFMVALAKVEASGGLPEFAAPSGLMLLGIVVGALVSIYLSVGFLFAIPLIIDRGIGAWQAMMVSIRVISHQWFRVFFLCLLAGFLSMLGLIGLFIGIFLTIPLFFASFLYAYEDMCNPKGAAPTAATPTSFTTPAA
ncbi:MAG TPA: DUF4339 domain-containing protein [Opitutaceae bacterium]